MQPGSKVIYDRANSALATIEPGMIDWDRPSKGADWFHWTGITPAISEGAAGPAWKPSRPPRTRPHRLSDLNYR